MAPSRHMPRVGGLVRPLLLVAGLASTEASAPSTGLRSSAAFDRHHITIKAPPHVKGTIEQEIAAVCAKGFNAAFEDCLGGANPYLMQIFTAAGKAYCGYQGGWAMTPESYPDHEACFASPGQPEALFFDAAGNQLKTWDGRVAISGVKPYWGPALNCNMEQGGPCASTVVPKYRRTITVNEKLEEMEPGQDRLLAWDSTMGSLHIVTYQPGQKQYMYAKHVWWSDGGDALVADVPCSTAGSVKDQVATFPVQGTKGYCRSHDYEYYMVMGSSVTVCFPGSPC